jgi:hypothetical protein
MPRPVLGGVHGEVVDHDVADAGRAHPAVGQEGLQGVDVPVAGVEVPLAGVERGAHGVASLVGRCLEDAEPEGRHAADTAQEAVIPVI